MSAEINPLGTSIISTWPPGTVVLLSVTVIPALAAAFAGSGPDATHATMPGRAATTKYRIFIEVLPKKGLRA